MGVKLNICLLLLLVADISSQGFSLLLLEMQQRTNHVHISCIYRVFIASQWLVLHLQPLVELCRLSFFLL